MCALLPRYPDFSAVIIGAVDDASFENGMKQKVDAAGLGARVRFMGELPIDDVPPWFRRILIYAFTSRNEGFGLTPLEAMASSTAVVASDAGAYAEMIVPGRTGMVVPSGDGDALRNAIEPYLADPERAKRHGENALAHVRQTFDIGNEVAGLNEVYRAVLTNGS